jgi:16S rRNA (guanine1207-N2)-methyltransferase
MKPLPQTADRVEARERTVAATLLDAWPLLQPAVPPGASVLVADDPTGVVEEGLGADHTVTAWRRVASPSRPASEWPAEGPFDAATLRLPRSREALELALHALAGRLRPGAPLLVHGANDEGIKGAMRRVREAVGGVETLDARRHCRVLVARMPPTPPPGLRPDLADWRRTQTLDLPGGPLELVSYPGVFAKGGLDAASELLLRALPPLEAGSHVLDYGCGIGVLGAGLLQASSDLRLQCIDADALAARATRENLPTAQVRCGASWGSLPAYTRYDRIVSNPPIHRGKDRDYTVLQRLITGAGARLLDSGELWMVVQRQVPVHDSLQQEFALIEVAAETTRFRVWRARQPFT